MNESEKKKRLLDTVERYAEAREEVAKSRAAVILEIDQLVVAEAPAPVALVEAPKKRAVRSHKERTDAKPPGRPSNRDRVLNVFKEAGAGVRLAADEVRERSGCGDNTFAYLSLLAKQGEIVRVEPGVYTLKG